MKAPELLQKAAQHMLDRAATYDSPDGERSMEKTVEAFNVIHGTSITAAQGWHFMQLLKDVRMFQRSEYHADSVEDCIAYAALKGEAMALSGEQHEAEWRAKAKEFLGKRTAYSFVFMGPSGDWYISKLKPVQHPYSWGFVREETRRINETIPRASNWTESLITRDDL